jgi:hypothetical protein
VTGHVYRIFLNKELHDCSDRLEVMGGKCKRQLLWTCGRDGRHKCLHNFGVGIR